MIDFSPAVWDAAFLYRLSLAGAPPIRRAALIRERALLGCAACGGHVALTLLAAAQLLERGHGVPREIAARVVAKALASAGPAPCDGTCDALCNCVDALWNAGRSDLVPLMAMAQEEWGASWPASLPAAPLGVRVSRVGPVH